MIFISSILSNVDNKYIGLEFSGCFRSPLLNTEIIPNLLASCYWIAVVVAGPQCEAGK